MDDYIIIDNFLDTNKCQELINLSEKIGYEEADISYSTGAKMIKEYRDNSRCLFKDEGLRLELEIALSRAGCINNSANYIKEGGILVKLPFLKLSSNLRFYKYVEGQKFKKHRDGNNLEDGGLSLYTVLIYLNSPEEGGETAIYDYKLADKYVLRTDFIYDIAWNEAINNFPSK